MIDKLINIYDDFKKSGRVQDLRQLAHEFKFDFQKRVVFGRQPTEIKGFKVFDSKGAKRFLGILSQPLENLDGIIRFYDYLKTKDLETKTQSIIEVRVNDIYTNYLKIEPKGTFSKMKGIFMSEKREFSNAVDFYKLYQISSASADAEIILQHSALSLLAQNPGITIEAEGNYFLFYYKKKEMDIRHIIRAIDFAEDFMELLVFDQSGDLVELK